MFHDLIIPSYDGYDFTSESFRKKLNTKIRVFSHEVCMYAFQLRTVHMTINRFVFVSEKGRQTGRFVCDMSTLTM